MIRVCAWCGRIEGETSDEPFKAATHTICEACLSEQLKYIDALPEMPACMHGKHPGEWCTPCEAEV